MTIQDIIERRKIKEVLHFTTSQGLTGILASKAIIPRKRLPKEKYLERIVIYNCKDRSRDLEWIDYVNLSITTINLHLFGISNSKWHKDIDGWWCVLSFKPEILTHSGVYFCTTNNAYPSVKREKGPVGLERLFTDKIERFPRWIAQRTSATPQNQPTCNQAEVLYPGLLSIDYLQHVYVENEEHAYATESIIGMFDGIPIIDCEVKPKVFVYGE